MQYNLEEFNTIINYIKDMNIQSEKGIVYSYPSTLILFDQYNVLDICHMKNYFKINFTDIHNNHILKYGVNDNFTYRSKNKDLNNLVDKKFNQIIQLWEVYK